MYKVEFFDNKKTYMYPNMTVATPERIVGDYSAVNNFRCVVTTDDYGEMFYAVESFNAMKSRLGIDPALSDADALTAISTILNAPAPVSDVASPEERIASALEFQNVLAMPVV
jgi:hypothetical protein